MQDNFQSIPFHLYSSDGKLVLIIISCRYLFKRSVKNNNKKKLVCMPNINECVHRNIMFSLLVVQISRYALTTIGGLLVFVLFWILLSKLNYNSDPSDISPADKTVFWVRHSIEYNSCSVHIFKITYTHYRNYCKDKHMQTHFHVQCMKCISMFDIMHYCLSQVMALILLALGFVITLPFQVWIRERSSLSARTKKIYEGFQKPMLYLVSLMSCKDLTLHLAMF